MKIFLTGLIATAAFTGCKKSDNELRPLSSFTIVNATTDVASAKGYAAPHEIFWKQLPNTDGAAQYVSGHFSAGSGSNLIRAVSAADATISLFSSTKEEQFNQAKTNVLFLTGNSTIGYEGVFLNNESLPVYSDSVMGIRYINLSPGSGPLTITLSTSPTTAEISDLSYKQITAFKTYPALQTTAAMIFQVRDGSNVLLGTFTLPFTPPTSGNYRTSAIPFARFKNITLVIKGLQGTTSGTNALGIFPVAHY